MRKTDITVDGHDESPILLWSVVLFDQPENEDSVFRLYDEDGDVEIPRYYLNSFDEVCDWNPNSDDKVVLLASAKRRFVRYIRQMLDKNLAENPERCKPLNVYVVRDYFDMSFGLVFTEKTLSEDSSYSIESFKTLSQAIMEKM